MIVPATGMTTDHTATFTHTISVTFVTIVFHQTFSQYLTDNCMATETPLNGHVLRHGNAITE